LALELLEALLELREDPVVLGLPDQGHLQDLTIGPGDEVVPVSDFDNVHEVGEKV
jgi:hypothetical protein